MEELLRQAFQLGQQWVQDISNDKEPTNFNDWYTSDEVQEKVKYCSIPAVRGSVCEHDYRVKDDEYDICIKCKLVTLRNETN